MKRGIILISLLVISSLFVGGCSTTNMKNHGHWIGVSDKDGWGYRLIYEDEEPEGTDPYKEKLKHRRDLVIKKESSHKTNQWTIDYYKIERRKNVKTKIDFSSGVSIPGPIFSH